MKPPTPLDTPCREYQGARSQPGGYGKRYVPRRGTVYVHRWVWEQINGPIPAGIEIMHRCDNPPCFRYDHLIAGTRADNAADMAAKGRSGRGNRPRREHCRLGHPIRQAPSGHRYCPQCQNDARRKRNWEHR